MVDRSGGGGTGYSSYGRSLTATFVARSAGDNAVTSIVSYNVKTQQTEILQTLSTFLSSTDPLPARRETAVSRISGIENKLNAIAVTLGIQNG
jgi:hypothetical protein